MTAADFQAYLEEDTDYEEFQRRGYGKQALLTLEANVKELGSDKITLHVFAHNHVAQALYEEVGYQKGGKVHVRHHDIQGVR